MATYAFMGSAGSATIPCAPSLIEQCANVGDGCRKRMRERFAYIRLHILSYIENNA